MSKNERQLPGLLLINENMPDLVTGFTRFLRKELAYRQDRRQIDGYSDLVVAASEIADRPVPVRFPVLAAATTHGLASGPRVKLAFNDAALLLIARAIARGIDILPVTFVVENEEQQSLLWHHPNAFVMEGAGVAGWSAELERFSVQTMQLHDDITDMVVDTAVSGMRIRAVLRERLLVGADDDAPALNNDPAPLSRTNLAAFFEEGLHRHSASFVIDSLTPAANLLNDLGHPDSYAVRKVFQDALTLACEKPVADFVASLPDAAQTAIGWISRWKDGSDSQPLDLDTLIRCLYVVGDLDRQELADLLQAMEAIPLVRGVFRAFARPSTPRRSDEFLVDLPYAPALALLDKLRASIVGRRSAHSALATLLGTLTSLDIPVRPATLRALVGQATLPSIEMIYGLDAYHRTFPKAPGCTLAEFGQVTDCLFHLDIDEMLAGDQFTDLAAAVAPTFRPSQDGLTLDEAKQAADMLGWIADCLEILAGDLATPAYTRHEFTKAAFSILFPPKVRPSRVRSIIKRWHLAIDGFETATFTAEVSCERYRGRIDPSQFPHFLKSAATVNYEGVAATVTPITSVEALLEEGRDMTNCVSTLRYAAASGYSLLVSIKTDAARSTAEYRPTEAGYELQRHEGPHSGAPDPIHTAIAASLAQAALSAPYAGEMLPKLIRLSQIDQMAPDEFMTDAEHIAYKDLIFTQLGNFLTRSERRLRRQVWTADLLPLHVERFRDAPLAEDEDLFYPTSSELLLKLRALHGRTTFLLG